ncbi:conserved hypothetical protein [Trichinella spiralis]|nr:conserved hypothetical protein [Trichinella spiralis]
MLDKNKCNHFTTIEAQLAAAEDNNQMTHLISLKKIGYRFID